MFVCARIYMAAILRISFDGLLPYAFVVKVPRLQSTTSIVGFTVDPSAAQRRLHFRPVTEMPPCLPHNCEGTGITCDPLSYASDPMVDQLFSNDNIKFAEFTFSMTQS